MPVHKRRYRSGQTTWYYEFDGPGSTREQRKRISQSGFATKQEAVEAEAKRRTEEQEKFERAQVGSPVVAPLPKTLAALLAEFFEQYVDCALAPKTAERYRELAAYLDPALLETLITDIKPLHLSREWKRLRESGGHTRRDKTPRPLSKKTVRGIAGVVSSAFTWAVEQELVERNPVTSSKPPVPAKPKGIGLSVAQQHALIEAASLVSSPWCLAAVLEVAVGLGARRGEVLALRWKDIIDGRAYIGRSLSQTRGGLEFKSLKGHEDTEPIRVVKIPSETLSTLAAHRRRQDEFRRQFGPDYRSDLDLVFANPDGTPLKPDSISAAVSALFKRLKIPKPKGASLHLLRHTLASQMLDSGVPLPVVSKRLGHASIRTTAEIYSHAIHGEDDEATRRWEDYQRRNRPAQSEAAGKELVQ